MSTYNAIGAQVIDIHSHILPGIDDGAGDFEQSLAMLKLAADSGTTDIVATPHANNEFPYNEAEIHRLFLELKDRSAGLLNVHLGCDFHLNFDNMTDAQQNPSKYTINNGRYLMVEMPDVMSLTVMRTALGRLLDMRIVPIITHPERNTSIRSNRKDLTGWIQDGCLFQVTAQSLTGRFGASAQSCAEAMIESRMAHFVASDAHDCVDRPPDMSTAFQVIQTRWGSERANALCVENPSAVLFDEPIYAAAPKPAKRSFAFWK